MTDITLCANNNCQLRSSCDRALKPHGEMQSVAMFQMINGECAYYLYAPGSDAEEPAKTEF